MRLQHLSMIVLPSWPACQWHTGSLLASHSVLLTVDVPAAVVLLPASNCFVFCHQQSLDLSHLTSLSHLTLFQLLPRDKLPASLTELRLFAPCTFSRALKLPQLQTLSISDSVFNGRADWGVLNHLNKLSALQSVAIHIDDPFGTSYGGGEFAPWTMAALNSYAPVLMGECGLPVCAACSCCSGHCRALPTASCCLLLSCFPFFLSLPLPDRYQAAQEPKADKFLPPT